MTQALQKPTITPTETFKELSAAQAGLSAALNSLRKGTRAHQDVEVRLARLDKFIIKFQQENKI